MESSSRKAPVWTEEICIHSYDVDATQRASVASLFRYFLEAAWNHAEELGFGFADLRRQNKFWALARVRFEIDRYPMWGNRVVLRTWPRSSEPVFALRELELLDEAGQRFGAASSAWLIVDSTSRRPQRIQKILPEFARLNAPAALEQNPVKLEANGIWEREEPRTVRYTDIDVNRHVNSARYLEWILDSYPTGFHLENNLLVLEVNYLNETLEGDQILLKTHESSRGDFAHSIHKLSGLEALRARLIWQRSGGGL